MSDEKLKECPFCGGEADLIVTEDGLAGNGGVSISCCVEMSDGYILKQYIRKGSKCGLTKVRGALIHRWNTRAQF